MMVGWKTAKLGEVCKMIKRGVAPKYLDQGGICVINQKCVRDHTINTDLARRHNLETKKVNPERYLQIGDVLVNSTGTGTLGRVAQVRQEPIEPSTVDTHITIVRPQPEKFFNDFFGYMLIKIEEEITSSGEGTSGQIELSRIVLSEKFTVSYPTALPEQKRIVAILDEAFAGIDAAVANTEKNLANARELFESYLNGVFTRKGDGWVEKTLGNIADFKNGLNFTKSSKGEKIKIVGVKNFKSNYWVPKENLDTVQIEGTLSVAYALQKRDILTVRSNGNKQLIGRCILTDELHEKTSHSGFTIRIRVHAPDVEPEYLVHYLKSSQVHELLINSGEGANISSLNQQALSSLPVLLPTIKEQAQIVSRIEAIAIESSRLESIYQQKFTALAELKQSILQKAFAGELTTMPEETFKEAVA